jgi:hypothetical protein
LKRAIVLSTLLLAAPVGSARADSLRGLFTTATTRPMGDALAESIGRSLPLTAASAGITFRFDKETHTFARETEILGQLFLERPRPLGRNKWNVSVSYQWVHVDRVDGVAMDELRDTRFIEDPIEPSDFIFRRFDVDLTTHEMTTSVTYGVTDDLDLNLTLPVLESRLTVHAVAENQFGRSLAERRHGSALGVGDMFLRAKQRFLSGRWGDLAAGLVLRLPSGAQDDFQGTGDWETSPMLYAATPVWRLTPLLAGQVYANGGIELNADDVDRSHGRFGAGFDLRFGERASLAIAVLGREAFAGIAPPGAFDVARADGGRAPFLGLERDRVSTYDVSLGGRVNLWRDTVFLFANVLLPLNDDGFRSDVIPLIGFEAAF